MSLRDEGRISDEVMHNVERDLDLEDRASTSKSRTLQVVLDRSGVA